MKLRRMVLSLALVFAISLFTFSCSSTSTNFNPNVEIDDSEPHFLFDDSGAAKFIFKTKRKVKLDNEIHLPIFFELPLPMPNEIINYSIAGMEEFIFFYKDGQTILLKTPFIDRKDFGISRFDPTAREIENLIEVELSKYYKKSQNDLNVSYKSIKYNPRRKNLIENLGTVQIIITNIKQENFSEFKSAIENFKILSE